MSRVGLEHMSQAINLYKFADAARPGRLPAGGKQSPGRLAEKAEERRFLLA
jgi:hypothetical protein